jgi:hypothetical protein
MLERVAPLAVDAARADEPPVIAFIGAHHLVADAFARNAVRRFRMNCPR